MRLTVPAEDIRDNDYLDIEALLNDPALGSWIYQPLGGDDTDRERAIEVARMVARMVGSSEMACADESEVRGDEVLVYTDLMNFIVPKGYQITVERNSDG